MDSISQLSALYDALVLVSAIIIVQLFAVLYMLGLIRKLFAQVEAEAEDGHVQRRKRT